MTVAIRKGDASDLDAFVELPAGVSGTFVWEGKEYPLQAGKNSPLGIK